MRLALDLQSCQSGSRLGGIGRYSLELAKAMIRSAGDHDINVILNSSLPDSINDVRWALSDLLPQDKILVFDSPLLVAEANCGTTKTQLAELVREDFLKSLNPDIVHVSSLFEGLHEEVVTSIGTLYPGNQTAVTLYDLIPLVHSNRYLAEKTARDHYLRKIESLRQAGLLLSISDFSRKEALDILNLDADRVVNISSAADERFRPTEFGIDESAALLSRYGLSRKFLMYTGSFDQRKNHRALIEAFGQLPLQVRRDYQLLIVGNGWSDMYDLLRGVGLQAGLSADELIFAGHVADEDLLLLYNKCYLFVFPSLAEGFGLPILEAMSCGTAAIGSNCTSIPEVIGWTDALFDPESTSSISACIYKALTDKAYWSALRQNGLKQARKFSWDISAQRAITAFEDQFDRTAISNTKSGAKTARHNLKIADWSEQELDTIKKIALIDDISTLPEGAFIEAAQCIAANQHQIDLSRILAAGEYSTLKIGCVTTWNIKCGIAAYSKFLLSDFRARMTILAADADWTTQPDDSNVIRCWASGEPDSLARLFNQIQLLKLHVLIIQFNFGFFDFASLAILLRNVAALGVRVFIIFHSTNDPSESKRLSTLKDAFAVCKGLFVHSLKDVNVLRQLCLEQTIFFIPQGVIANQKSTVPDMQLGGCQIIAAYGFALPHKGLLELVEAFAVLHQQSKKPLHLLLINAVYPADISAKLISEIRARSAALGVAERVTLIDEFLPDEVSLGYLSLANLIVYPYQDTGESSSAAVRMGLASGRPVAVTPLDIFSDVRSSVFTLPGCDVASLAAGIRAVLDQISTGETTAVKIMTSASRWVVAHYYSGVSKHFFSLLNRPKLMPIQYNLAPPYVLSQKVEKLVYEGTFIGLKTFSGSIVEGLIKSAGVAGPLICGPWISVAPGNYRAIIYGVIDDLGTGPARADVVVEAGTKCLAYQEVILKSSTKVLANLPFQVLADGVRDLEVRFLVCEKSSISISAIEILPTE